MMTPTGIVRIFGFIGTAAFLGLAATSTGTIRAQNGDQPPPPPPIVSAPAKPEAPAIAPASTPTEDKPLPAFPEVAEIGSAPSSPPAEPKAPEAKPAPTVEEIQPVPVDAPSAAKTPEAPAIPRSPEPQGLEAPAVAADPEPIAEAAPARARISEPASPSPSEDPDAQARSFVERSRKEAEAQLKTLNAEAAQLRNRLQRIESGIRRWQALVDAMDRSEQEMPERLEALPRSRPTSAARRSQPKSSSVIRSTPEPQGRQEFVAGPDGVFRPVAPSADADSVTRAQFVPAPTPR
jgi:hypothetical protein